jgi:hypothetical protein
MDRSGIIYQLKWAQMQITTYSARTLLLGNVIPASGDQSGRRIDDRSGIAFE